MITNGCGVIHTDRSPNQYLAMPTIDMTSPDASFVVGSPFWIDGGLTADL